MKDEMTPFSELIADETAFTLSEALHWLALTCERQYAGQIQRHLATLYNDRQLNLKQLKLKLNPPCNTHPPGE